MIRTARIHAVFLGLATALALAATPAAAWTQRTQLAIVETAAKLAPDDLARQIERHKAALREGVLDSFADHSGNRHETNADGSGRLREVLRTEARRTVAGIEGHHCRCDLDIVGWERRPCRQRRRRFARRAHPERAVVDVKSVVRRVSDFERLRALVEVGAQQIVGPTERFVGDISEALADR